MEPSVVVKGGLSAFLADAIAGSLAGATVGLFVNDVDPGKNAIAADLTPAAFVNSTPLVATWGEVYINANGDPEVSSQLMQWDWDSGADETVYGIMVKSAGAGTPLLAYARLDEAKQMNDTGDSVAVVVRLTLSAEGFGSAVQVSE